MFEETFVIEEIGELYGLKVYIDYDGPKLFSCFDQNFKNYVAVLTDMSENYDKWLLVECSDERLNELEEDKISLYNFFKEPENGFLWLVTEDFEKMRNVAKTITPKDLTDKDLPQRGVYLNTKDKTGNLLLEKTKIYAHLTGSDIVNVSIAYRGNHKKEIPAELLGDVLKGFQKILNAEYGGNRKQLRNEEKEKLTLYVVGVYDGSFGVRLKSCRVSVPLFEKQPIDTPVSKFLVELFDFLEIDDVQNLAIFLETKNKRILQHYIDFLRKLRSSDSHINYCFASPMGRIKSGSLSIEKINEKYEKITKELEKRTDIKTLSGEFVGVNIENMSFEFITTEKEKIKGKISDELRNFTFQVPKHAQIIVEFSESYNEVNQAIETKYTLLNITYLNSGEDI